MNSPVNFTHLEGGAGCELVADNGAGVRSPPRSSPLNRRAAALEPSGEFANRDGKRIAHANFVGDGESGRGGVLP